MTKKTAFERDLVFVDLETSGFNPDTQDILEIAAIRTTSDAVTIGGRFERKVLPVNIQSADPQALVINRYNPEHWLKHGVSLDEALDGFLNICFGGVTLVAHSATFDWGFLRAALTRKSLLADLDYHIICTASLAWPLVMRGEVVSPKLETLCTHFGISNEGQHSAMCDVERMLEVYRQLVPVRALNNQANCEYCRMLIRSPELFVGMKCSVHETKSEAPEIPVKPG